MNVDVLKTELHRYYDSYDSVGVVLYALFKGDESNTPRKIDLESDASDGLKDLFFQSLKDLVSDREDLSVVNLSSSDERLDAIYLYDIELPEDLKAVEGVLGDVDIPLVNMSDVSLSDIKALIVEIGNSDRQLILYKTMAPINIFGRKNFFLVKSNTRLEKIDEEFLRVSSGFQLMRINGQFLVFDLSSVEKSFGFHDVIKREAAKGVGAIKSIDILENPEVLDELIDDVKYARKFTKVYNSSPVIKLGISNESIIDFCEKFPDLAGSIRLDKEKNKILLDTKRSKDAFIGVLMDNYLTSELTKSHYRSLAKDEVKVKAISEEVVEVM